MSDNKRKRFYRVFPWYYCFSADLLFWVAVDTLFLSIAKHLSSAQIVSMTTITMFVNLLLTFPLLIVIRRIGTTASVRISSVLLFGAAVCITFGQSYAVILTGRILHEISATFQNMSNAALKNNLEYDGIGEDFITIRGKGNIVYAAATMIISFIASPLFNIGPYLPMYACIGCTAVNMVLTPFIIDTTPAGAPEKNVPRKKRVPAESVKKHKLYLPVIVVLVFLLYFFYFPTANSGQTEGKLYIQEELMLVYSEETTALAIGGMLVVSRITRLLSNLVLAKAYRKYKDKVLLPLLILLPVSLGLMTAGYFIHTNLLLRFGIMMLGYVIILFLRDPVMTTLQNMLLRYSHREDQVTLLSLFEFGRRIVHTAMNLGFTVMLVALPMISVVIALLILALMTLVPGLILYRKLGSAVMPQTDDVKTSEI